MKKFSVFFKNKKYLNILIGSASALLLIIFISPLFVSSWVRNKLESSFKEEKSDYIVTIGKVKASFIPSGIELETIKIDTKKDYSGIIEVNGEIASIKIRGINLVRFILRNDLKIRKIIISDGNLTGNTSAPDTIIPILIPLNIRIGILHFDRINLAVTNKANAASFSFSEGVLRLYDMHVEKYDTLSTDIVKQFDFNAREFVFVSADSMYRYRNTGIIYNTKTNTLAIDSIYLQPNYADYDFTSRYKFQKNRIEASLSDICFHDFDIAGYIRTGNLICSFVELGKINMKIFRDNRKELNHTNKPEFQNMIYNYGGNIKIDSMALLKGTFTYTEHTFEANEPGYIRFNEIHARLYKITNDTIYRTDTAFFKFKGDALVMGKGKISVLLNARIFDLKNTFSMYGTLTAMEANELNPLLEKKVFVYVTSGLINGMKFSFIADNTGAHGTMTILYQGLNLTVKNKITDDTTAFRERVFSWIVSRRVMNSNPLPNDEVREGIIDFKRDPERFLPHYCTGAILSGIISSFQKDPSR